MLIDKADKNKIELYKDYLKRAGMLSGLFSASDSPYIASRMAENIFCLAFEAENLGRADCSADAKLGVVGIGIKTFLAGNNKTMQKIAEFNKDAEKIRNKRAESIVKIISNLRNERILTTMRIYGIETMVYHCVVREVNQIKICEMPMEQIDIANIGNVFTKKNGSVIVFDDGKNEYSFNLNKNTLYRRFDTSMEIDKVDVEILENPYGTLGRLFTYETNYEMKNREECLESIILPLFSDRGGRNVPEKSGLNQWNAAGRLRDCNEIYIPIPSWIHDKFPAFFPDRNTSFLLTLPNGKELSAKLCQAGSKALMSNPNADLGKWLLRDVMNVKEGELLTYEKLETLGIDSVEIYKIDNETYKIDFRPIGTYDEFYEENFENKFH